MQGFRRLASTGLLAVAGAAALAAGAAAAPTPTTVGPNVNVSVRAGNQTEGTVAVDPGNTQRVFVASNDESQNLAGLFTARSADGGTNWTAANVGTGAGGDGFPAACCDPSASWDNFGNLFFTYLSIAGSGSSQTRQVILLLSTDGGANWTNLATIAAKTGGAPQLDQPTVTTGANTVWVSYRDGAGSISARGANVTALGTVGAFVAAQVAPGSAGGNFGDIAIGPTGQVLVTYQVPANTATGASTIFVNLDADGTGAGVFAAAVTATTTNVSGFDVIPPQPDRTVDAEAGLAYDRSGGANNGRVYLVYTEETTDENNDTDIMVRFSNNNGATWSAAVRANDDVGTTSQFLPRISLDQSNGDIAVSWHDARSDSGAGADADGANNDAQYWGTFSTTGGVSFLANVQISAGTSDEDGAQPPAGCCADIDYGDYTGNSFAQGRMHSVWADNSNSTADNPAGALATFDIYTALVTPPQPNRPPTVDAGPDVSGPEGSPIALDGTVTDPDDPSPATTWTYTPGAGVDPGATCSFANPNAVDTTITCTDDGTYTATLTANDGFAPPVSDSTTVTVSNAPPTVVITSPPNNALFAHGSTVSVSSSVTDPGSNDSHVCTIDWDDGVVDVFPASGGSCSGSHVYAAPGTYTIVVTATDDDGGSGSDTVTVRVAGIELTPEFAVNELGTPGQTHTVTATVAAGNPVAGATVVFTIVSGPNAGATATATTNASGQATFTYTARQGLAGLGDDVIEACFVDPQGNRTCDRATKRWQDTTAPTVTCKPTTNSGGKNVPGAGADPSSGQNPDGFYVLKANDAVDPALKIFVHDDASPFVAGPFPSGTKIKLVEASGQPGVKAATGAIQWKINLLGDAIVSSTDASGNTGTAVCRVPPKPK